MSQRITDEGIEQCIKDAPFYTPMIVKMALDLRDARARIRELEALSASQAQALDLMEAGKL